MRKALWRKRTLWLLIPIIAIVLLVLVVRSLRAPAEGSINETPPTQAATVTPYSQPGTYGGKYISFTYPAHFRKEPSKLTGNLLEVADYGSTSLDGKTIVISVYKGSFSSDSSVIFRQQHPELYKENTSKIGLEFTKNDGTEDTYFIAHDGMIASVSTTSAGSSLNQEALFVASGLKWR